MEYTGLQADENVIKRISTLLDVNKQQLASILKFEKPPESPVNIKKSGIPGKPGRLPQGFKASLELLLEDGMADKLTTDEILAHASNRKTKLVQVLLSVSRNEIKLEQLFNKEFLVQKHLYYTLVRCVVDHVQNVFADAIGRTAAAKEGFFFCGSRFLREFLFKTRPRR